MKLSEPWVCRSQDGFCFEVPLEVRFIRLSSVYTTQLWLKTSKNPWLVAVPRWVSISFQVPSGPGDFIFFSFLGLAGACEESEKLHHWDFRWVRLFPHLSVLFLIFVSGHDWKTYWPHLHSCLQNSSQLVFLSAFFRFLRGWCSGLWCPHLWGKCLLVFLRV